MTSAWLHIALFQYQYEDPELDGLFSIEWHEIFIPSVPLEEILIRGTVMYWFLFLMFRFVVRRDVGAVGIADILLLVIVADAAQNGMAGQYESVTDGMLLVATLMFWNKFFDWLSFRFPGLRGLLEPKPLRIIKDGRMLFRNMRHELITEDELWSSLRQQGIESLSQVKEAYMESDGKISVIQKK